MKKSKDILRENIAYIPIVRLEVIQELLQEHIPAFANNPKEYGYITHASAELAEAIKKLYEVEETLLTLVERGK